MEFICKCNKCDSILIDTNPQIGQIMVNINSMSLDSLISLDDMKACPICQTDEYLTDLENLDINL